MRTTTTPPRTIRRRCPCGAHLTVSTHPDDRLADACAVLFDTDHDACRDGDPLRLRLAVEGDIPDPLFDLETT